MYKELEDPNFMIVEKKKRSESKKDIRDKCTSKQLIRCFPNNNSLLDLLIF